MTDKPVVYYKGVANFSMWNPTHEVAHLPYVLNHPNLGRCYDVRTSTVLHKFSDGTIETRNTVYKPAAAKFGDNRTWHQLQPQEQRQVIMGINMIMGVLK